LATPLAQRLAFFERANNTSLLTELRRGIEKESLRTDASGKLALSPHPAAFGSAMTHPSITTDFSEALLEFITPVSRSIDDTLNELDAIHRFAYAELGEEILWNASMPCILGKQDDDIPVAQYGNSNPAKMKTRYRLGLGHRYSRKMQTISGIHYNFSLPPALWQALYAEEGGGGNFDDFVTERYFALIRNFRRYAWLLVYLFGAAPAVSRCFLNGKPNSLQPFGDITLYKPKATSLRMGDLGYQSDAQKNLNICYNRMDNYINTLREAIITSHPDYEGFPKDQQLSTGLLQIENEFYSPIRPKRVTASGEIPLRALQRGGVEYIEVRCLDVNPMLPVGIDAEQIRFLDAFLMFCLCDDSPYCDDDVNAATIANMLKVVDSGREANLQLCDKGQKRTLANWGSELLDGVDQLAALLDKAHGGDNYLQSSRKQRAKLSDSSLTPSAQIVAQLETHTLSYHDFALQSSQQHADSFRRRGLSSAEAQRFADLNAQSQAELQALEETADLESFDAYLQRFYEQYQQL
jgi:glutamate--cysteine ligase